MTWIWPAAETIHFIGLALVLGIAGFFDARLMGFFRHVPVRAAHGLMPYAMFGFLLNLVTGLTFFIGHPEQYVHNVAWWFKVGCLALAGVNALVFEWTVSARTLPLGAGEDTPPAAKAIGAISLCLLARRALLGPHAAVHRRRVLTRQGPAHVSGFAW